MSVAARKIEPRQTRLDPAPSWGPPAMNGQLSPIDLQQPLRTATRASALRTLLDFIANQRPVMAFDEFERDVADMARLGARVDLIATALGRSREDVVTALVKLAS